MDAELEQHRLHQVALDDRAGYPAFATLGCESLSIKALIASVRSVQTQSASSIAPFVKMGIPFAGPSR